MIISTICSNEKFKFTIKKSQLSSNLESNELKEPSLPNSDSNNNTPNPDKDNNIPNDEPVLIVKTTPLTSRPLHDPKYPGTRKRDEQIQRHYDAKVYAKTIRNLFFGKIYKNLVKNRSIGRNQLQMISFITSNVVVSYK